MIMWDRPDIGMAGDAEASYIEVICNKCGTTVIVERNSTPAICALCGSTALATQKLTQEFGPEYIIPFKITNDEAKKKLAEYIAARRFVPPFLKRDAVFENITGLYVPFWLIDGVCHMKIRGEGRNIKDNDHFDKYEVDLIQDINIRGVPFDGSSAVSDNLMEAIEPFDMRGLKPFHKMYLNGYPAERFNMSTGNMSDRIGDRVARYAEQYAGSMCGEYDEFKVVKNDSYTDGLEQRYALFPVWFMNYEYKGEQYMMAVNGQTGEAAGDVPVSALKTFLRRLTFFGLASAPLLALTGFLTVKILKYFDAVSDFLMHFFLPYILFVAVLCMIPKWHRIYFPREKADLTGLFSFLDKPYYAIKTKYTNLGNDNTRSLQDAPDAGQYLKTMPDKPLQKESRFLGTARVNKKA